MELNDKIRGALVGFAFGDAMGLGTEFMTQAEIAAYYPNKLRHFDQIIRDSHRSLWNRCEYTNDTRALTALIEDIIKRGEYNIFSQARALKEFVDDTDFDLTPKIIACCQAPGFLEHPISTAHRVWQEHGFKEESNEFMQRAVLAGIIADDDDQIYEITRQLTLLTHDDTRCVSSATIVAHMVHSLLYKGRESTYEELEEISQGIDSRTTVYLKKTYEGKIDELEIDDEETQAWARKSMSSSLWSLLNSDNATDAVFMTIDLGGDADTNASLTGAMAGIKYGFDSLPEETKKMANYDYIVDLADRFTEYLLKTKSELA